MLGSNFQETLVPYIWYKCTFCLRWSSVTLSLSSSLLTSFLNWKLFKKITANISTDYCEIHMFCNYDENKHVIAYFLYCNMHDTMVSKVSSCLWIMIINFFVPKFQDKVLGCVCILGSVKVKKYLFYGLILQSFSCSQGFDFTLTSR